jgi:hypothetical protein
LEFIVVERLEAPAAAKMRSEFALKFPAESVLAPPSVALKLLPDQFVLAFPVQKKLLEFTVAIRLSVVAVLLSE